MHFCIQHIVYPYMNIFSMYMRHKLNKCAHTIMVYMRNVATLYRCTLYILAPYNPRYACANILGSIMYDAKL